MTEEVVCEPVNVTINGRVATVELNNGDCINTLDREMLRSLALKLKEISGSDDIDIVVLTGSGGVFSAGDIKTTVTDMDENDFSSVMETISELAITLYCLPKLTITAIKGEAFGLGLSLALATDYILADRDSKVAMNFIKLGLIPDGGAHFFLEKLIGEARAKHLIWKGETLTATEAYDLGIINKVTDEPMSIAIDEIIEDWLKQPLQAMIKTKKIFAENSRPQLLKILELEKIAQQKMRETEDYHEGIQAFFEKREPKFKGK